MGHSHRLPCRVPGPGLHHRTFQVLHDCRPLGGGYSLLCLGFPFRHIRSCSLPHPANSSCSKGPPSASLPTCPARDSGLLAKEPLTARRGPGPHLGTRAERNPPQSVTTHRTPLSPGGSPEGASEKSRTQRRNTQL